MYFRDQKVKNIFYAQCLEDFRRPVGPEYIIKDTAEYREYLVCIRKILDQILLSNQGRKKDNILKCIAFLSWIIISSGFLVGIHYFAIYMEEQHPVGGILLGPLCFGGALLCLGIIGSSCILIVYTIRDKRYYNIYHLIDERLYDTYEHNNTLAEICYIQKFRHSRHDIEEKKYCYPYNKQGLYSSLKHIDKIEFMILADAKRFAYGFKGISNNTSNKNFLELPQDEIIKKYEEEIYSKEKAPIPESFLSN